MKKLLSILITPLLAVSMFFGCSKVERDATSVRTLYSAYMDSYITNGNNNVFKHNEIAYGEVGDEGDYITDSEENTLPTYEKIMYIVYDDTYGLNNAVQNGNSVTDVGTQTYQLKSVYQRILSLVFNYYANWYNNFYIVMPDKEMTVEEWNSLYNDLAELQQSTDAFLTYKLELEREVRMNGGVSGALVSSKLNTFNSHYNDLIISSLKFVNNFKDLHKKYIFNNADITPNSAKRWVDESLLLIAEAVFYDNVLAFEQNEKTVIHNLENSESQYVWINTNNWKNLTLSQSDVYANSNINAVVDEDTNATIADMLALVGESDAKTEAISRIRELVMYATSFDQNLQNYKSILAKTNKINYNSERGLITASTSFSFDGLSFEEQSNIRYLQTFSFNKIYTMFGALYQVMGEPEYL